ncbi:MAG: DUF924 domain-containing protein [Hydrococcus sp. Prado102]|jgi:uncharacterized protein (DUF924 family)|nr:DUF924 domain-containing protein [Hydrococcus sp. Prado102]
MSDFQSILDFWFGKPDEPNYGRSRKEWFVKNSIFDEKVRSRFLKTYQKAASGEFDSWQESPLSCLALIIAIDQFPRNMFRNTPQAFATDDRALP